tara:strand:+ start:220 stop:1167 length:948 start_codon:yes stop_codon:yes gene_type:complete
MSLEKIESNKGFSLIELVVVIAVLSILTSISIPLFTHLVHLAEKVIATLVIQNIKKECENNLGPSINQFNKSILFGYSYNPENSNNCIHSNGYLTLSSLNPKTNPSFHYSSATKEITCTFGTDGFIDFTAQFPGCKKSSAYISLTNFNKKLQAADAAGILLEDKVYTRGDSKYVVVKGSTWEEAQANSNKLGGHLTSINDKEENDYLINELYGPNKVSDQLVGPGNNSVWIGFNDRKSEGSWEQVSGEKKSFTNWAPGEPDGKAGYKSGEQYANFNLKRTYNRSPGMWSDVPNGGNPNLAGDRGVQYGLAEIKIK